VRPEPARRACAAATATTAHNKYANKILIKTSCFPIRGPSKGPCGPEFLCVLFCFLSIADPMPSMLSQRGRTSPRLLTILSLACKN